MPRFGERVVSVPLTVSAFSAFRQAWGLSNNAPTRGMPYVVKGKLAGGLFGTVRFSEKGTLDFSGPAVGAPKTKGSEAVRQGARNPI